MKLKLLLLADHKSPHTRRWADWMASRGHQVSVFSLNGNDRVDATGMMYREDVGVCGPGRIRHRLPRLFFGLLSAIYACRSLKPDVIHAHSTGSYTWLGMLLAGARLVVTPWGKDLVEDLRPSVWEFWLTKRALTRAAAITTDGAHLLPILFGLGVRNDRIFQHEWGVDTDFFKPSPVPTDVSHGPIRIVSTRTPTAVHNVECLLHACQILNSFPGRFEFLVVGAGSQLDALKRLAATSDLQNDVRFTGMLNQHQLLEVLQTSHVYVSTSPVDAGLSVSTAEAMSCGLPVIHPDVADNRNWTPDGLGGVLYPPRDHFALASAILSLVDRTSEWRVIGERNRAMMCNKNSTKKNMEDIERMYCRLVFDLQ